MAGGLAHESMHRAFDPLNIQFVFTDECVDGVFEIFIGDKCDNKGPLNAFSMSIFPHIY
jgi:hypothetical protein